MPVLRESLALAAEANSLYQKLQDKCKTADDAENFSRAYLEELGKCK